MIRSLGDVFINAYQGASLHILAAGKVEIPNGVILTGVDPVIGQWAGYFKSGMFSIRTCSVYPRLISGLLLIEEKYSVGLTAPSKPHKS